MDTLITILLIVVAVLLLFLAIAYSNYTQAVKEFEKSSVAYQKSFIDIAGLVTKISDEHVFIKQIIHNNEEELDVVKSILTVHSEALNIQQLKNLHEKLDQIREGEHK